MPQHTQPRPFGRDLATLEVIFEEDLAELPYMDRDDAKAREHALRTVQTNLEKRVGDAAHREHLANVAARWLDDLLEHASIPRDEVNVAFCARRNRLFELYLDEFRARRGAKLVAQVTRYGDYVCEIQDVTKSVSYVSTRAQHDALEALADALCARNDDWWKGV